MLRSGADPGGLVPPDVAAFLAAVHAYSSPVTVGAASVDVYDMRARLVSHLARANGALGDVIDLRALVELASSNSPDGQRLRDALHEGETEDVARAVAAAGND